VMQRSSAKRAGNRHAAARPRPPALPSPGRPDQQRNFLFLEAAIPPPSSIDLPATPEGR
jgi:hypothetical protein